MAKDRTFTVGRALSPKQLSTLFQASSDNRARDLARIFVHARFVGRENPRRGMLERTKVLVIATEEELPATGFCLVLDWEPDTGVVLLRFCCG